jgi:6-phosphogluconolactonase
MNSRTLVFAGCLNRPSSYFENANGRGIAVVDLDEASGRLTLLYETYSVDNPSFLALEPSRGIVYATSEVAGWNEGVVSAYQVNTATGQLSYLGKQPTLGSISVYCGLDRSGRYLLVANYAHDTVGEAPGQHVTSFPIGEDGALRPAVSHWEHHGAGRHPQRQTVPHGHCAVTSPDNRFAIDQLLTYRFDSDTGRLAPAHDIAPLTLGPCGGPRHLEFDRDGRFAYVVNELDSTVCVLRYLRDSGELKLLQNLSTVPPHTEGNAAADLQISRDGRFLYVSNRGHDSIATYLVETSTGKLTHAAWSPSGGSTPRSIALSPSGRFMLVANQNSDEILSFRLDEQTGRPDRRIDSLAIGTPMCVKTAQFAL